MIAVSGGVDSMALLWLLNNLAAESGWKLSVAHFNHQLRGRASDADERFVERVAQQLGLPFHAGRGAVKALAKRRGLSIEMAAREMRHQFLAQTARRLKCPVIAVAHHADDQVELFFLRMLRGAGGEGLAGMKWSSVSPASRQVRIARPLLNVSKEELEKFARENQIRFREDASNASRDMLRNRVRHELLPLLRKNFQPALNRTVLRLMEVVGAEADVVNIAAIDWLAKPSRSVAWGKLMTGVQRRVIQVQLQRLGLLPDFELIESLRLQPGKIISVGLNQSVICDEAGRVKWRTVASRVFKSEERKLNLKARASVSFGGMDLAWNFTKGRSRFTRNKPATVEFFDSDKVGDKIILRYWRPGDRFQPIGMKTAVKLQDWFTNQKIPAARRRELGVATTAQGEIFWVEGLRIGEKFKLTPLTWRVLAWRWLVRKAPEVLHCEAASPMLGFAR
ncbi:MAG: tRNA lysidine(34) synthetase TilS [Verrucomicrobiota bacterium]